MILALNGLCRVYLFEPLFWIVYMSLALIAKLNIILAIAIAPKYSLVRCHTPITKLLN